MEYGAISFRCCRCLESPVHGLSTLSENSVYCVRFKDPEYSEDFVFPAKKLKDAKAPLRVLKPEDLDPEASRKWRPVIGMVPSTNRYRFLLISILLSLNWFSLWNTKHQFVIV